MPKKKLSAKPGFTLNVDPEILAVLDQMTIDTREKRNILIQRAIREFLERAGKWPPQPKKKAGA